jgi:hypothetical protein
LEQEYNRINDEARPAWETYRKREEMEACSEKSIKGKKLTRKKRIKLNFEHSSPNRL